MNYTVASMVGHHTGFSISMDNQRNIFIRQYDTEDETNLLNSASFNYKTSQEAKEAFLRIATCILDSTYNFEDRKKML